MSTKTLLYFHEKEMLKRGRLSEKIRKQILELKVVAYLAYSLLDITSSYSKYCSLLNRHGAQNKRGGGKEEPFLIGVVPIISVVVAKMRHS